MNTEELARMKIAHLQERLANASKFEDDAKRFLFLSKLLSDEEWEKITGCPLVNLRSLNKTEEDVYRTALDIIRNGGKWVP